jgi:1-acyl-sn-glycerol-3-phosphate acyltransferase
MKRFARILAYTVSMYLVTHLIVFFYLFPVGTSLIIFDARNGNRVKKTITAALFRIIGQRLKVFGMENLERGKNYVIVSNYPGSYAGFALMNVFPDASILVHSFLSKVPVVGFLLKSTGAIFVQQKAFGKSKRAIDETLRHNENRSILILPEGGRSPDGQIRKFRRGFIYILRHSSMDLVPVTLRGFYRLKPLKRAYLDPDSDLDVVIHKPINRSTIGSLNDEELLKLTTDTIQKAYIP